MGDAIFSVLVLLARHFSPLLLTSSFYLSRELPLCNMMSYNFKRDKQVYLAEHIVVCRAI